MNQELVNRFIDLQNQANWEIETQGEVTDETNDELVLTSEMLGEDDIEWLATQYSLDIDEEYLNEWEIQAS